MSDQSHSSGRGGARPGAGRPKEVEDRRTRSFEIGKVHDETIQSLADERGWSRSKALRHILDKWGQSSS